MREIESEEIAQAVRQLFLEACLCPPKEVMEAIANAAETEPSEQGREVLRQLEEKQENFRREVEAAGVEFQVFQPGAKVHACLACYHCLNTGSLRCVQTDDMVNDIIAACIEADGILLAAPVYHGGIAGGMKCVLDRLMLAAGCGVNQLHHKVGGALCTLRRSGGMETYQQLLGTMDAMEMVIVTSDYWGAVHGADPGEVQGDTEGMEVAAKLGRNMAWTVKALAAAKETLPPPESHKRTFTNFIR